jgi:hypothetical protein
LRRFVGGPVPRVFVEGRDQRLQVGEQLPPGGHRKSPDDSHRGQRAVDLVQPEQQRVDGVVIRLVHPVTRDDAVSGANVLDLEHDSLVRLVGDRGRFGDDTVEARSLQLGEPPHGALAVGGRRSEVETRSGTGQCADQGGATLAEGSAGEVVVTECEQVERVMDGVWG